METTSTVAAMDARLKCPRPLSCCMIGLEATCMLNQSCATTDARPTNKTVLANVVHAHALCIHPASLMACEYMAVVWGPRSLITAHAQPRLELQVIAGVRSAFLLHHDNWTTWRRSGQGNPSVPHTRKCPSTMRHLECGLVDSTTSQRPHHR